MEKVTDIQKEKNVLLNKLIKFNRVNTLQKPNFKTKEGCKILKKKNCRIYRSLSRMFYFNIKIWGKYFFNECPWSRAKKVSVLQDFQRTGHEVLFITWGKRLFLWWALFVPVLVWVNHFAVLLSSIPMVHTVILFCDSFLPLNVSVVHLKTTIFHHWPVESISVYNLRLNFNNFQ